MAGAAESPGDFIPARFIKLSLTGEALTMKSLSVVAGLTPAYSWMTCL